MRVAFRPIRDESKDESKTVWSLPTYEHADVVRLGNDGVPLVIDGGKVVKVTEAACDGDYELFDDTRRVFDGTGWSDAGESSRALTALLNRSTKRMRGRSGWNPDA